MRNGLRRVLYTGTILSGVRTSMLYVAQDRGRTLEGEMTSRHGLSTTTDDGTELLVFSDVRSSYFYETSLDGIARAERPDADAHQRSLKPLFQLHLEFLRLADGVVFVVDSQIERREANLGRLDRLRADLAAVGRRDIEVALVFQLNKRDCTSASSIDVLESELRWPGCSHVASIAKTGEGVIDALRTVLAMTAAKQTSTA